MEMDFTCPICGRTSRLIHVSEAYFEAVSNIPVADIGNGILFPIPETGEEGIHIYPHTQMEILQKFAPPSNPRVPFHLSLHPDQFAILLLLIGAYFVYFTWSTAPSHWVWAAGGLAGLILLYLGFRRRIVHAYQAQKAGLDGQKQKLEKMVDIWNRLVYCAADGMIFDPATSIQMQPGATQKYLEEQISQIYG
jgi:hypothetical protein